MVPDSAQIRRQGAQDFMAYYEFACARQESVPLPAVKMNLNKGMLDFNGDKLKLADWPPVLSSISINKHLHHIAISSTYQASLASGEADRRYLKSSFRRKIPAIRSKDMTLKLCKALRECLTVSPNLKMLQLNGLPLRERDLITLTKGLAKSTSLENLSLVNCPISDEGLEVICQSVKYSTNIRAVDFSGCSLTWRGAEHMANIIKHQGMQRHGTAWAESLRYRQPQFEGMGGLRRVTLNCNTLIGDRGAAALASELAEDLWVKAVDLQRCGLSNEGARRLLEALKTNSSLCVLDIRGNPLVDKLLIKTIIEKVLMNSHGQSPEYCWIKPAASEPQRASGPRRRALPSTVRGKAAFRIVIWRHATHKGPSPGGRSSAAALKPKPSRTPHVPWRAAARAGRQRGLPPGITVTDHSFQGAATVKVTMESDSEAEEDDEEEVVEVEPRPSSLNRQDRVIARRFEQIQMELKECRMRLGEERRARLKAESRLMEYELENARLRDANHSLSEALATSGSALAPPASSALEDEAILESIETSFTKFHAFLDLLKDAGLGQLASMAGIDKSDFHPLGRPQLSSTIEPLLHGAASPPGGRYRIDALSLVGGAPSAALVGLSDTRLHKSPSPTRAALHKERSLDVTFTQASAPAASGVVDVEEEANHFSKPDTQHDSGSEHSFYSQKSFDNISFGKTSQTRPSHPTSNSNSHRNNSSHGYSFSNSYTYNRASHSNGSRGGSSASVSDILSDKEDSVGSVGSRNRGNGRLVTVGQSGSEGSERKAPSRRGALEQVRSLESLGVRSDNES
ncbi:centrosomal protein of 78 kDa isoform X1 [Pelmatolapia mariae]|uniref:centrosomal protein of 78 kDa isoform X1 n=1 Tax=Pelmatolapia mariae TaxID=158779 RepID=UPI002FE5EF10